MAISPLSPTAPATISGAGTQKAQAFGDVLKSQARSETAPMPVVNEVKATEPARVPEAKSVNAADVIGEVSRAQTRMDEILKAAESGKSFSPAELLSLQTHVYRASQELDLAGKVVEKATGGVKQVLQTQV